MTFLGCLETCSGEGSAEDWTGAITYSGSKYLSSETESVDVKRTQSVVDPVGLEKKIRYFKNKIEIRAPYEDRKLVVERQCQAEGSSESSPSAAAVGEHLGKRCLEKVISCLLLPQLV